MAQEEKNVAVASSLADVDSSGQQKFVTQDRRYVGTKETVAYVVYDMSQSFNIDGFSDRFITSILQISLPLQRVVKLINSIWDTVNDIFIGAIVDRTRTRWGKFKPYLVALGVPGTIGTCTYWMLPLFFMGTGGNDMAKFITYFLLTIVREGAGTFRDIARKGLQATMTPHPNDRTRLITTASLISGLVGEKLPSQIMNVLLDLIERNVINISLTNTFVIMGIVTAVISGAGALWYFLICKERVMQSVERPSIKASIKSVISNKPILLMTLSKMLSGLSLSGNKSDYFIDVLHFASLGMITGIPGAIVNPFSYLAVPWFRKHFSSRFLYIMGSYLFDILLVPVFFFGAIGGKKNGMYKKIVPMGIAFAIWEVLVMVFWGVRSVIPTEMYNEAMDYCEWKNGYRTEGMTSVAQGLAEKLSKIVSSYISLWVKQLIGYDITAYVRGSAQSDDTQFGLFAMCTIVPFVTTSLGIIPMLFYDLGGKKKDKMYEELLERRAAMSKEATAGDMDALDKLAKLQIEIGNKHQTLD